MRRSILSIATGSPIYLELAVNLARSFKYWHQGSDIQFTLATDQAALVPDDLRDIQIKHLEPGQYGQGFSPKLYLNELAPATQTLFVDADCLCTGPLNDAFDRFAGRAVSVVGQKITHGEWFGDVASIRKVFNLDAIPRFNGGVYYLEKGAGSDAVFQTAQDLEDRYDKIGFRRLRTRPNDEVLISLAMALLGQEPVREDGTIMNSTLACPAGMDIDVLRGVSRLYNPKDHPDHNDWYPLEEMNPTLVHFLGYQAGRYPYQREALRLKRVLAEGWSIPAADAWTACFYSGPWLLRECAKDLLRPLYHSVFGPRTINKAPDSRQ